MPAQTFGLRDLHAVKLRLSAVYRVLGNAMTAGNARHRGAGFVCSLRIELVSLRTSACVSFWNFPESEVQGNHAFRLARITEVRSKSYLQVKILFQ